MNNTSFKTVLEPDHKPLVFPRTIVAFMDTFDTKEKCLNYIASIKWGDRGWRCSYCGYNKFTLITTRNLIRCKKCKYDESFIANTTMRKTRKPLRYWFWAMYMLATQKTGLSAMELYRQLDFGTYKTAWAWLQKIRMAMVNPERVKLNGTIEVDETYIYTGEERGRKLEREKALIVCAVEVKKSKEDKIASGRIRLRQISSASAEHLHSFILDHIQKGSTVKTDGWKGYSGLSRYGYEHIIEIVGDPKEASKKFPRVHRVFANLKAWLIGTHRFVSAKHIQNYLNEYTFRFNRRKYPKRAFNSLLKIAVSMQARPYRKFTKVEKPVYANP